MEFTFKINATIIAMGGLDVPTGSIYVGKTNGFTTVKDIDHLNYIGAFFKSKAAMEAGKPALQLEKMHDNPLSETGMRRRAAGQEYNFKGSVSANDFIYNAEIIDNKAELTEASSTSWISQVKQQIATKLSIEVSSIS